MSLAAVDVLRRDHRTLVRATSLGIEAKPVGGGHAERLSLYSGRCGYGSLGSVASSEAAIRGSSEDVTRSSAVLGLFVAASKREESFRSVRRVWCVAHRHWRDLFGYAIKKAVALRALDGG